MEDYKDEDLKRFGDFVVKDGGSSFDTNWLKVIGYCKKTLRYGDITLHIHDGRPVSADDIKKKLKLE
ncbi:MAG: hypothetical protein A2992_06490 [Elusimicrobia bacterium RIFCSPLOWO2_01_FULL_59_12]|nr:MAG: hypothetical protein A2992_06490 [Elusimicrobia bacterium RIFCSPLOWO2_01_FULL_59_12]